MYIQEYLIHVTLQLSIRKKLTIDIIPNSGHDWKKKKTKPQKTPETFL